MKDKIYIILLNWNGWPDTIECLTSVLRNTYSCYRVIVCDNGSSDDSLLHLKAWAHKQDMNYIEYTRAQAEAGGRAGTDPLLVFIQTGENLGFAGGNNVGIRYALARKDFSYIWLLNNDTVIDKNALAAMVIRMKSNKRAGLCGSMLLYYHKPDTIQACGGFVYNKWLGTSHSLGQWRHVRNGLLVDQVEKYMFGVQGASVLVSHDFLQTVGLLSEDYFLYFEEQDWAVRARLQGFCLVYAADSMVYHKEGQSSGAQDYNIPEKSLLADYYMLRNRLLFTRKFYPWALPTVYFGFLGTIFNRVRRGQWDRLAGGVMKILFRGGPS